MGGGGVGRGGGVGGGEGGNMRAREEPHIREMRGRKQGK